jgi:hypothetical protein
MRRILIGTVRRLLIDTVRRLLICTARQIFLGDQMKNNEMGEACSKYGGQESFIRVLMGKRAGESN